ncbi:2-O-methyltransferase NoeI [Planctomycetes bacterium K23_9]|uniref:2-O-methyltransferase NoeI n=1 Tax=Stieleria marina TaxID=1930275 RepID=A0A517NWG4_9BACT|nr:2-O-methyltransferase NoeI [Planctomycetes bacterium K23_9]
MHAVAKSFAKRISHRIKNTTGYRLLRTKRLGVDWLDDATRIASEGWNPQFTSLDTVFDVGANIGQTARKLSERTDATKIFSFEPVPSTFAELKKNTCHLPNVQCFVYGLSDVNGEAKINVYGASVLASTCDHTPIMSPECSSFQHTETIQLRTLDSVCEEHDINRVDVLKTDTEGADLRTIRGAEKMLAQKRIGFVLFEFYCPESDNTQNGTLFPVNAALAKHGYRLVSFYTDYVNDKQSIGVYNALYMATA